MVDSKTSEFFISVFIQKQIGFEINGFKTRVIKNMGFQVK